jgi:hypothetical protein
MAFACSNFFIGTAWLMLLQVFQDKKEASGAR